LLAQGEFVLIPEKLLKEMPYIETLFSGRFNVSEEAGVVKSDEINGKLLTIIIKYLDSGKLYKLLGSLTAACDLYHLLELFHFLAIKPPITTTKKDIHETLKKPPSIAVTSQKDLVVYAFAIFHGYQLLNFGKEKKTRDRIYNTVRFVFEKQKESFKPRAKLHLLKLAKKCVPFTNNQLKKLNDFESQLLVGSKSDSESEGSNFDSDTDDWFDDCYDDCYGYHCSSDEFDDFSFNYMNRFHGIFDFDQHDMYGFDEYHNHYY